MELATDQLDRLIERRASKEPDPDEREESYMESVRRFNARRRHEALWDRLRYHERMLANHTATFTEILDKHKAGVSRCEAMLGIEATNTERK